VNDEGTIISAPTVLLGSLARLAAILSWKEFVMRSSLSRSWLSMAAWFYVGPFVAIAGLALFVLGFAGLAVTMQVLASFLKHIGI
jgi:hypothetical protein